MTRTDLQQAINSAYRDLATALMRDCSESEQNYHEEGIAALESQKDQLNCGACTFKAESTEELSAHTEAKHIAPNVVRPRYIAVIGAIILSALIGCARAPQPPVATAAAIPAPTASETTDSSHEYHKGPRGGCYYINAKGGKVYGSKSNCK